MEYIKTVIDGYVVAVQSHAPVGKGNCTEEEYGAIMTAIKSAPAPAKGYAVRLREDDLTWEVYKLPMDEMDSEAPEAEKTDLERRVAYLEEAMDMLLSGQTEVSGHG